LVKVWAYEYGVNVLFYDMNPQIRFLSSMKQKRRGEGIGENDREVSYQTVCSASPDFEKETEKGHSTVKNYVAKQT